MDPEMNKAKFIVAMECFTLGDTYDSALKRFPQFLLDWRVQLYTAFAWLHRITARHFEQNLTEKLGGRNSRVIIDTNFGEEQQWPNTFKVICIFDLSANKGYLEVIVNANAQIAIKSIIDEVVKTDSEICNADRTSGEFVAEVEQYRNKYPNIKTALTQVTLYHNVDCYIRQMMWLDRFGDKNRFWNYWEHFEEFIEIHGKTELFDSLKPEAN